MTQANGKKRTVGLAERIYLALKNDIFDFRLMPGEHFSENEISERMAASRTPVRQALFWLEHEGYVQVYSCLLYTSPSPRDPKTSRMPSSA